MQFLEAENFTNVSIDLIYALPGQTLEGYLDTLEKLWLWICLTILCTH